MGARQPPSKGPDEPQYSTADAALGLGAFAVFNQIISGTGIFGHSERAVVARPTVIERQVFVAPPPPVVVAPQPVVVYQTPTPVYYTPAPVYYQTYVQYVPVQHRSEEHTSELQSPCNLVCRL